MFSVFLVQLDSSCHRLYSMVLKQNFEIHRIDKIINELNSLSGMDKINRQLKIKKEELERQQQKLLDMLQGLEKIRMCYSTVERRILENGEGCRIKYKYSYHIQKFSMFTGNDAELTPIIIT